MRTVRQSDAENADATSGLSREDARSLAYHVAITEKLMTEPDVVIWHARRNLDLWSSTHSGAGSLFERFDSISAFDQTLRQRILAWIDTGMNTT